MNIKREFKKYINKPKRNWKTPNKRRSKNMRKGTLKINNKKYKI